MNIPILKNQKNAFRLKRYFSIISLETLLLAIALTLALCATAYFYAKGYIVAYGDAESHLNIAKRVVDSLTPGFAQLGGIWLPLPHLLLVPFMYSDFLWRTGLAGSIVSGTAFVISALYIYKLVFLVVQQKKAALFAFFIFVTNPNILYLQSTPMTELVLIAFFVISTYYFILYFYDTTKIHNLVYAAFFGFCASLSRYDGWGLVLMEAGLLSLNIFLSKQIKINWREKWEKIEGKFILFATLAFFGIFLWFLWGYLILGDPLYFTHSEFSAKSQQNSWYVRGELPSYRNLSSSLLYYSFTTVANTGVIISLITLLGLIFFVFDKKIKNRFLMLGILAVPFIFNVSTLYLGQSVIFIPNLTPESFGWRLFNVRYGVMMIPFVAFFAGYLFYRCIKNKLIGAYLGLGLIALTLFTLFSFANGDNQVITIEDGIHGLSSDMVNIQDAEVWFKKNYDYGMLLTDDFSRVISIIRTPISMKDDIYVGNKPYWDESLKEPEKYARWIIIQKDDLVWKSIWDNPVVQARLFKYFNKVYTSNEVLIFKRIDE